MDDNTICEIHSRCDKCAKSYDGIFMEIKDITEVDCVPYRFMQNGLCWCFCLESLHKWISVNSTNPMTRTVIDKKIIDDIEKKYKSIFASDDDEYEKEVSKFIELVVDTQQSIALKYGSKPSLDTTAEEVYIMLKEIYEINDEPEEKIKKLKGIKKDAIKRLEERFKILDKKK